MKAERRKTHEQLGYRYDAAGNLSHRTNNALVQSFTVNSLNELSAAAWEGTLTVAGTTAGEATDVTVWGTGLASGGATRYLDRTWARAGAVPVSGTNTYTAAARDTYGRSDTNTVSCVLSPVSFTYDLNGNLLSDGRRAFDYDDENQLIRVTVTNSWKSEFLYDGKMRRRVRTECAWVGGAWVTNSIVRYVYDGNLVLQERWFTRAAPSTGGREKTKFLSVDTFKRILNCSDELLLFRPLRSAME